MIKLYFTLKILIPLTIIILILTTLIIFSIKYKIDSKTKKNCFNCKYYKLHDVSSCSGICRYKCILKNTYHKHNFNDRVKFTKCKEFKNKYHKEL